MKATCVFLFMAALTLGCAADAARDTSPPLSAASQQLSGSKPVPTTIVRQCPRIRTGPTRKRAPSVTGDNLSVVVDQDGRVEAKRIHAYAKRADLFQRMFTRVVWMGCQRAR